MGYISDVESIIYGKPDEVLKLLAVDAMTDQHLNKVWPEIWSKVTFDYSRYIKDDETGEYKREEEVYYGIHMCDTGKWYDDYDHVVAWDKFMRGSTERADVQWEFIRVGEEDGDVERDCSDGWEILYTETPAIGHHLELDLSWEEKDGQG